MIYQNLLINQKDSIKLIMINRPEVLNALNVDTLNELMEALTDAHHDENTKVILITGAGNRSFVAGADIAQMSGLSTYEGRRMTLLGQKVFSYIEEMDKPIIAIVNGFALGGGCELAMACDIRVASRKAKFGQPEVNLGIIPGFGGTQRLPRLIGKGRAKYFIFTGDMIPAEEAFRIGLVDRLVEKDEELMSTAFEIAKQIISKPTIALAMAKSAINTGLNLDLKSGIAFEAEAYTTAFSSADRIEGMMAFVEKRKANFQGQ